MKNMEKTWNKQPYIPERNFQVIFHQSYAEIWNYNSIAGKSYPLVALYLRKNQAILIENRG